MRRACQDGEAALADEEGLVHVGELVEAHFEGIGKAVRILPDDEVAFLETQHAVVLRRQRRDAGAPPACINRCHTSGACAKGRWIS